MAEGHVLAITTPGCRHCKAVRPSLEAAAAAHDDVRYREISAPEHPEIVAAHGVRGIPTILAVWEGRVVGRHVGAGSRRDVDLMFQVARGEAASRGTVGRTDRLLRTVAGAVLTLVGILAAAWWMVPIGVLLLGAGWHDLVTPRGRALPWSSPPEEPAAVRAPDPSATTPSQLPGRPSERTHDHDP